MNIMKSQIKQGYIRQEVNVVQLTASETQQLICGDDVNVCKLLGKKGISGFHYGDWRRSQARCSAK